MIDNSFEKWQRADEEVRKNLPPGVKLVRTLRGHRGAVGRIAWSPAGRMLASPSWDKTIRLWDVGTGKCLHTLKGHTEPVYSVVFAPSGQMLVSTSADGTLKIWKKESGKLIRSQQTSGNVSRVAFDPKGQMFASCNEKGIVNFWNAATEKFSLSIENQPSTMTTEL